jgi:hypothetical protein
VDRHQSRVIPVACAQATGVANATRGFDNTPNSENSFDDNLLQLGDSGRPVVHLGHSESATRMTATMTELRNHTREANVQQLAD